VDLASLWPWLAVAGVGALHGLNPASGWIWAAAWGVRSRDGAQPLRALVPIAIGHLASIALVAGAVYSGLALDRGWLQVLAAGLCVPVVLAHLSRHTPLVVRAPAGHAGLALWSFAVSTAQGAGLMLVPALAPLCLGAPRAAATSALGALGLALAALAVHTAAMLAVTGLLASGVCRGWKALGDWRGGMARHRASDRRRRFVEWRT
jgi:hypothetical protein